MQSFFGRRNEFKQILEFAQKKGSGLTFLRGRRRVGKSWLLKEFQGRNKRNCFYFSGVVDETGQKILARFVKEWDAFAKTSTLSQYRVSALTWHQVFGVVGQYAQKQKLPLVLMFDEIQWIAKKSTGLIGSIKEAWLDWEKTGKIKLILCGSSNQFFNQYTGGEEKILRGLKTHASIWVKPFTLTEVKKYYFPQWKLEEICLVYMMLGGIPYYLAQIDSSLGFVHSVNQALFVGETIFLEEVDEVLNLEFNKKGVETVKKILSQLGQDGTTQVKLKEKTGFSFSYLSEILAKLVDVKLVFKKFPAGKTVSHRDTGCLYFMKDFFLNFYFQVLAPFQLQIKNNRHGLLFPYASLSHQGYYVPNFSGKAFELLVRTILEETFVSEKAPRIFAKLLFKDNNFDVMTFWDAKTQIDLLVTHNTDRLVRLIECRWISSATLEPKQVVQEVLNKQYIPPPQHQVKRYAMLSPKVSSDTIEKARRLGVEILSLEDLLTRDGKRNFKFNRTY